MAWEDFEKDGIKGFTGDKPFDEFAIALAKIATAYEERFDRKPIMMELMYALERILQSNAKNYISDPENFKLFNVTNHNNFMTTLNEINPIEYEGAFADRPDPGYHVIYRKAVNNKNQPEVDVIKIPVLDVQNRTLVCKYEILANEITDEQARNLVLSVILEEFADNYYKDVADEIEFINTKSGFNTKVSYK